MTHHSRLPARLLWSGSLVLGALSLACSSPSPRESGALEAIIHEMEFGGPFEVADLDADEKGAGATIVVRADEATVRAGLRPPPGSLRQDLLPVSGSLGDSLVPDPADLDGSDTCSVNLSLADADDPGAEPVPDGSTGVVIVSYCR